MNVLRQLLQIPYMLKGYKKDQSNLTSFRNAHTKHDGVFISILKT